MEAEKTLNREKSTSKVITFNFKLYYRAIVNKKKWHWHKTGMYSKRMETEDQMHTSNPQKFDSWQK